MGVHTKHYVVFESPGVLVSETSSREIGEWVTRQAAGMASEIGGRYGAKPYCFRFETRITADPIDDGRGSVLDVVSKPIAESGRYFIRGTLRTLDEIQAAKRSDESILASNMECNDWPIVCETRNSYLSTQPFREEDFVVDGDGNITERGDDPRHVAYRKSTIERVKRERGY